MSKLEKRIVSILQTREEAGKQGLAESGEILDALNSTRGPSDPEVTLETICRALRAMQKTGTVELVEGLGPLVRSDLPVMLADAAYLYE